MKFAEKIALFLFVLLIFSLSVGRDFSLLFQTQAATGIDGYYYVLQIETLRSQRHLYFPSRAPLTIYFLTALSFLTQNVTVAVKIGAVFLHVFLVIGMFAITTTLTRNVWLGILSLLITAASGLHPYMVGEFLSNLGALTFLVWGAFGIVKAKQNKKTLWFVFSISFFICAVFSHRSASGLIVLFSFTILSANLLLNKDFKVNRRFLAFSTALFFLPFVVSRQSFFALPEWAALELSKIPNSPFQSTSLAEHSMLAIVLVSTIFLRIKFKRVFQDKFVSVSLLSIVLWSFWLTLNPFLNHQTGFQGIVGRLDCLAYLQAAVAVPLFVSLLLEISRQTAIIAAVIFIALLVGSSFAPLPVGLQSEYLRTREKLVAELPALRSQICEKPFIVARHGEQFAVTAILRVPSEQKPPGENLYQCVYWLIRRDDVFSLIEDAEMRRMFGNSDRSEWQGWISENPHLRELIEARVQP